MPEEEEEPGKEESEESKEEDWEENEDWEEEESQEDDAIQLDINEKPKPISGAPKRVWISQFFKAKNSDRDSIPPRSKRQRFWEGKSAA